MSVADASTSAANQAWAGFGAVLAGHATGWGALIYVKLGHDVDSFRFASSLICPGAVAFLLELVGAVLAIVALRARRRGATGGLGPAIAALVLAAIGMIGVAALTIAGWALLVAAASV